jgi:hypothetical protein
MGYILVIAATFGVLFAIDKGLTRLFRSRQQHHSGTAVRLKKYYGILSLALMILGVLGILTWFSDRTPALQVGGLLVVPGGAALGIYYLTHGIFYDDEGFLYTTFGNRSAEYRYADIAAQKLYEIQGGSLLVELHMTDGSAVSVQGNMEGAYDFLSKAAHARMRQLGLNSHECSWFDETEGKWFPPVEE